MDILFEISALSVLPFWGLAIFAPHRALTKRVMSSPWIVMPPIVCYLLLAVPHLPEMVDAMIGPSLDTIAPLFGSRWGTNMLWAQVGAWDLLAGRWMYLDSQKREISAWIVSPILFVTIFFGPIGFALYALVRVGLHFRGAPALEEPA